MTSAPPPGNDDPYAQPQYGQPSYAQPSYGQPQYGRSSYGQPQYGYPGGYGYGYPGAQPGPPPASMAARLGARVLDGLIFGVPAAILFVVVSVGAASSATFDPVTGNPPAWFGLLLGLLLLLLVVAYALYEILFTARSGSTPGKRIVGIKVTREDGSPVSTSAAAVRWAVYYLPNLVPVLNIFWGVLVAVSPFFDAIRRQGWHDKVAKTVVVSPASGHRPSSERPY